MQWARMEKENYEIKSVVFEGGDQVGKGDAAINVAKELSEKGEDVILVSFPFYATPIGTTIRLVLSGGYDEFKEIPAMKDAIGNSRQTECVMALFALNRLETLSCLKNLGEEGKFLVFDRSSYSHALTISYNMVSGAISDEELNYVVENAIGMDIAFIEALNLKNCVVQLCRKNSKWSATRGEGEDKYESRDVQEICDDVYSKFSERVGRGWVKIITREGDNWRERSTIKDEIMEHINRRITQRQEGESGNFEILKLDEAIGCIYPDVELDKDEIATWNYALDMNDKKRMYQSAVNIGRSMAMGITQIILDPKTKNAMGAIFEEYPECYALLAHFVGESYAIKLSKAINEH